MQCFCNSGHVSNLLVMVSRLDDLSESIMSIHTRLLRPSINYHSFLCCILHFSCVVDSAREDSFPLARILMPKEVHLRQLAT